MVPGFDRGLALNLNDLMFADDLIIITSASRSANGNYKLCLDIYRDLTGQRANLSKSSIHLHGWCNRKVSSAIKSILGMNLGYFPFSPPMP